MVSILIPVWNGEQFVDRCFESIVSQTYADFEVIIVDDGSTDKTKDLLSQWKQRDGRFTYYLCEHKGIVGALNYGLDRCNGEFIARMDIDDEMVTDRLEKQLAYLANHPEYDFIGGAMINDSGGKAFNVPQDGSLKRALFHPQMPHPSVMFKKASLDEYNLRYIEGTDDYEDVVLYIEALLRGMKYRNTGDVVMIRHRHENEVTVLKKDIIKRQLAYIKGHYPKEWKMLT
jgi:glycosyltransferase involved in cell wall biosynthesis